MNLHVYLRTILYLAGIIIKCRGTINLYSIPASQIGPFTQSLGVVPSDFLKLGQFRLWIKIAPREVDTDTLIIYCTYLVGTTVSRV